MQDNHYRKPQVIAEIGCNHKGEIEIAKDLIRLAKESGADVAKFQKRTPASLLTEEAYNAPHPVPHNSYGMTYGEHREKLEFTIEEHAELMAVCRELNIIYSSSVWDNQSAQEMVSLKPDFIKVGSPSNTNFEMLELLRDDYKGDIHISFGMTTHEEERSIIEFLNKNGDAPGRVVIYACTSGYPVKFEDLSLLEISRLKNEYGEIVKEIGFSGHHLGIAADIAAYTLGASWIERHFTKDRTWKGTDHAASLEPGGLSKLIRDLNAVHSALNYKRSELLPVEEIQRVKLKYRPS